MDEIRAIRLEVYADPEYGIVAQSRLHCEKSRILCERARIAAAMAAANCARAERARRNHPPPRWMARALRDLEEAAREA